MGFRANSCVLMIFCQLISVNIGVASQIAGEQTAIGKQSDNGSQGTIRSGCLLFTYAVC
jgi:hypothetical protein